LEDVLAVGADSEDDSEELGGGKSGWAGGAQALTRALGGGEVVDCEVVLGGGHGGSVTTGSGTGKVGMAQAAT
jgi:hypothetical protein